MMLWLISVLFCCLCLTRKRSAVVYNSRFYTELLQYHHNEDPSQGRLCFLTLEQCSNFFLNTDIDFVLLPPLLLFQRSNTDHSFHLFYRTFLQNGETTVQPWTGCGKGANMYPLTYSVYWHRFGSQPSWCVRNWITSCQWLHLSTLQRVILINFGGLMKIFTYLFKTDHRILI